MNKYELFSFCILPTALYSPHTMLAERRYIDSVAEPTDSCHGLEAEIVSDPPAGLTVKIIEEI